MELQRFLIEEQAHRLGRRLLARGCLTQEQLDAALSEQALSGRPLAEILRESMASDELSSALEEEGRHEFARARLARSGEPPPEAQAFLNDPSRQLDCFVLVESLGRGGAGEVWKAWDRALGRWVAVKIAAQSALERSCREAQAAARLRHPHIVPIHRIAEDRGRSFIVMQLVEGRTLDEVRLPLTRAVEIMKSVAEAVQAAHAQGVIHRDLKPANIMLDHRGHPWIFDFGLAHLLEDPKRLTATGAAVGTPSYMSPEQARGDAAARRATTDIYALGATLYELACGRPPFVGNSFAEVVRQVIDCEPPPPRHVRPHLPREIELIVLKAMDKDPQRRYRTAADLAEDLRRYLQNEPIQARPPTWAYRCRKKIARHRSLIAVGAAGLFLATVVSLAVIPRWMNDRARDEALRELSCLWTDLVLAKQGWYKAYVDPSRTRQKIEAVRDEIGEFVIRRPDLPHGYYVRARAHFYLDDLRSAAADLEQALKLNPEFTPAWALLGRIRLEQYQARGWYYSRIYDEDVREAEPMLREAQIAFEKGASDSKWGLKKLDEDEEAEVLARALKLYYVDRQRREARAVLEQAHQRRPSEEYCHRLGLWSSTPAGSIVWQSRAIQIMPHCAKAYLRRGFAKLGSKPTSAIEDFTRVLAIQPGHEDALIARSAARGELGDWNGKAADNEQVLARNPNNDSALYHLADAKVELGDVAGAMPLIHRAIALGPSFPPHYVLRARIRTLLNDWNGALADCNLAVEKTRSRKALYGPVVEAYIQRAEIKMKRGEFLDAVEDCSTAMRIFPNYGKAFKMRAFAYYRWALVDRTQARALLTLAHRDFGSAKLASKVGSPESRHMGRWMKRARTSARLLGEFRAAF